MSIVKFGIVANFKEIDETVGRLVSAMQPGNLHQVGASRAYRQTKGKYAARFAAQVKKGSGYQSFKKKIPVLPHDGDPGFLTGTTFNSISQDFSDEEARIFLGGTWPQGKQHYPSGRAKEKQNPLGPDAEDRIDPNDVMSGDRAWPAKIHWGPGDTVQLFGYVKRYSHIASGKLGTFEYGPPSRRIQFMVLDSEDIDLIVGDMQQVLTAAIKGQDSVRPTGGEKVEKVEEIPIPKAEAKALEKETEISEMGVSLQDEINRMRARGVSEVFIEREMKQYEVWLRGQK